jgi:hypothetical protein
MNLQFYSGTQVNWYGFMVTIPKPVVPVGYNFFPIYILIGIKYDPNPAPNRGFTSRVSGIRYPLTSLVYLGPERLNPIII